MNISSASQFQSSTSSEDSDTDNLYKLYAQNNVEFSKITDADGDHVISEEEQQSIDDIAASYAKYDTEFNTQADTDGNNIISDEEQQALIDTIDINGDGYIDHTEKQLFALGKTEETKEMIAGSDGVVTAEEYTDFMELVYQVDTEDNGEITVELIEKVATIKELMDLNKDGTVDETEKYIFKLGIDDKEEAATFMEIADTNFDGKVSEEELKEFLILLQLALMIMSMLGESVTDIKDVLAKVKEIKAEADENGDNKVSPEEILKYLHKKLGGEDDSTEEEKAETKTQAQEMHDELTKNSELPPEKLQDLLKNLGLDNTDSNNETPASNDSDSTSTPSDSSSGTTTTNTTAS